MGFPWSLNNPGRDLDLFTGLEGTVACLLYVWCGAVLVALQVNLTFKWLDHWDCCDGDELNFLGTVSLSGFVYVCVFKSLPKSSVHLTIKDICFMFPPTSDDQNEPERMDA